MNDEIGALGRLGCTWCKTTVIRYPQSPCYRNNPLRFFNSQDGLYIKKSRDLMSICIDILYYIFLNKDLPQQILIVNVWRAFCVVPLKYLSLIRRFYFKILFNNPTPISCCMPLPQYCGPDLARTSTGVSNQIWISGMCCNQQTRLNQIIFHFCFQKTQRQQCTLPANDLQICFLKNGGVFKFYECEKSEVIQMPFFPSLDTLFFLFNPSISTFLLFTCFQ